MNVYRVTCFTEAWLRHETIPIPLLPIDGLSVCPGQTDTALKMARGKAVEMPFSLTTDGVTRGSRCD